MRREGFYPVIFTAVAAIVFVSTAGTPPAWASAPEYSIRSVAWPTNFQSSTEGGRNRYTLVIQNVGSAASTGTITVTDKLPVGIKTSEFNAAQRQNPTWECTETASREEVTCTRTKPGYVGLGPLEETTIELPLAGVPSGERSLLNTAKVEEAGGPTVATSEPSTLPNTVEGPAPTFGIRDFSFEALNGDGEVDQQAGDHPNAVTTSFDLEMPAVFQEGAGAFLSSEEVKEAVVDLPLGFVGDPEAAARCSLAELAASAGSPGPGIPAKPGCPADSRIGTFSRQNLETGFHELNAPLFNMVPEKGYPAEFGMYVTELQKWVMLYASVVHSNAGYMLQVRVPGILRAGRVAGVSLTLFGDPAENDGDGIAPLALFTDPAACSGEPSEAKLEVVSWQNPGRRVSREAVNPEVTGCNMLQFDPAIEVTPETTQVDAPSGYEVDLKIPQSEDLAPVLASPDLKNATVTLPAAVSISPGAADGLMGCRESGPEGIDMPFGERSPDEAGEGEEIGADGLSHLTEGHCPALSKIGTVELETPLLPAHSLKGSVFLAQPKCGGEDQPACTQTSATNGELYGLYLEIEGDGIVIKLKGTLSADPATGQLTTTFAENPQLPFSELKLKLKGGPRAPLANPQSCSTVTATSDLEPWSAPVTADATPSSSFAITGCAGSPFAPSFSAGTVTPSAGAFSPFTLTFSRHDGEQDLSGLTVTTPPGLLGVLKSVVQCPEAQAQKGECGSQSLIGHTEVATGAGPDPFWEPGTVYLTGPYRSAPFGLSIVTPAQAGPFNLGNVIVRAAIRVNPNTSALTVTSDPLPQIVDGIPLRIQTVNVTIDRSGFMFNPTNCDQQEITGTIVSAQGAAENVSSSFAVANCATLAFKPGFSASTSGHASKAGGASLDVKVSYPNGLFGTYANVKSVKVDLPKQLPSRLSTLHLACVAKTFEADPANCPPESDVGMATASTPLLNVPLRGPAYIVSYGNEKFPNLEIVLQGEGITLILEGNTQIKDGITSSTFKAVPDAPVSNFELKLPTGKYSILGANVPQSAKYSLCGQKLAMPTAITGQNGAVIRQSTNIAITGCSKTKTALTRAQKLTKALKACRKKSKGKRVGCEKRARKQYAPAKVEAKKKAQQAA